ncbi:MAG: glycosyl transferase [Gammaproteobacteria bacterium]|nr:glycosyl transferase [Gammaproteobacteria bacterium]MBT5054861.1 glycosyl transferase [Gammaproteobacteria bacterium]MDC0464155.1 hypothetical protein [Pseudomonadales bacterium]
MEDQTPYHVICFKWGVKYGADYVNRLYGMVARNLSADFLLHCFTDDARGIRAEVRCHDLPDLGCEVPVNVPGMWRKAAVWRADLGGIQGVALFVDLDSVIVDDLTPFFEFGDPNDVILARNWLKPFSKLGQTTLFRFKVGAQRYLLEDFQKDPQGVAERFQFEQHYVTKSVRGGVRFWPNAWVKHYRVHCLPGYIGRYFRPAVLPKGARVIAFPGEPNPADALVGQWTNGAPVTAKTHFFNLLNPERRLHKSWRGHFCCFQKPCPFVQAHWRE